MVLSAAPVRLIQDVAGVTPLLFLNKFPMYRPIAQIRLLEGWFAVTLIYFAASFLILLAGYRRLNHPRQRRSTGTLILAQVLLGFFVLHNFLVRNWAGWFGSRPPNLFSDAGFVGAALLLIAVPLTIAYSILTDEPHARDNGPRGS